MVLTSSHSQPARPRVLSIAGTDPTGGAGIHADLKSIMAAGGYGMAITTALVAQNTQGVRAIHTPPLDFLAAQLNSVYDDVTVDALKIGMISDATVADLLHSFLISHNSTTPCVIDPVAVASSGDSLLQDDAVEALKELINSVATVITPNIPELSLLTKTAIATTKEEAINIAQRWMETLTHSTTQVTPPTIIIKMGHLSGKDAGNIAVFPDGRTFHVSAERINTHNTHGTGCSLSSALATRLGAGNSMEDALSWATRWINRAIRSADSLQVGKGHGPINHSVDLRA